MREGRGGGKEANKKQSEQQLKFVKMPGGSSPPHHRATAPAGEEMTRN